MRVEEFLEQEINRRRFLGDSARNAAGVAAGMVGISGAASGRGASAADRLRLGVIGVRSQGQTLALESLQADNLQIIAVCDIDAAVRNRAAAAIGEGQGWRPRSESDFRRLLDDPGLDAVLIAAPDHWHALMTVLACQAGKDVYVEAPLSHTIVEGARMVDVARRTGRVVQCGLQQRSGGHFQSAVDFVRSGRLGTVKLAKAWSVHRRKSIGRKPDGTPPPGVDYDLWLGPAEERAFNPNRFHHNWNWFWDYGSGELGQWGVHLLDIARWGLDVELPSRVSASGGRLYFGDDQQTPDTLAVHYTYPDATLVWEHRLWTRHGNEGRSAAAAFYGDNGTLIVDRSGWKVYDRRESLTADASELKRTHLKDFFDAIRTRRESIADVHTGHISSALCHLGNTAYRLGRDVFVDPDGPNLVRDEEAVALCSREYRSPWTWPTV